MGFWHACSGLLVAGSRKAQPGERSFYIPAYQTRITSPLPKEAFSKLGRMKSGAGAERSSAVCKPSPGGVISASVLYAATVIPARSAAEIFKGEGAHISR